MYGTTAVQLNLKIRDIFAIQKPPELATSLDPQSSHVQRMHGPAVEGNRAVFDWMDLLLAPSLVSDGLFDWSICPIEMSERANDGIATVASVQKPRQL